MDAMLGGFLMVPVIVGLVEVAKRLGLAPIYAAPLAIALGLLFSVGYTLAAGLPGGEPVANAVLRGLALGLSAAGLHSSALCRRHERGPAEERRWPRTGRQSPRPEGAEGDPVKRDVPPR